MKQPGYPLPDGELGEDDIVCQLVYLPDRPEYWQAFLGALSYMTTWRAWERDDDKRGKDAASNWREAFELTMECWRMTCLDDLKSDVSDILDYLRSQEPCCDENITYGDTTIYITTIIPGVGDPPDYYGETEVDDWDDWKEHLCYNAHLWVDELISNANSMETALSLGGLGLALLAYAYGAFNFLFMHGELNQSTLLLRLVNTIAGYSIALFSDAADDIETARDDIICAIMLGGDVADAVEDALASGDAWDLIYQFVDYDSAMAVLYEGGDGDDDFLSSETRDDCTCIEGYTMYILPAPGGTMDDQNHFSSIFSGGCHRTAQIRVKSDSTGLDVAWKLISSGVPGTECPPSQKFQVFDFPGETRIYNSVVPPVNISNCKYYAVTTGEAHVEGPIEWTVE